MTQAVELKQTIYKWVKREWSEIYLGKANRSNFLGKQNAAQLKLKNNRLASLVHICHKLPFREKLLFKVEDKASHNQGETLLFLPIAPTQAHMVTVLTDNDFVGQINIAVDLSSIQELVHVCNTFGETDWIHGQRNIQMKGLLKKETIPRRWEKTHENFISNDL